MKMSDIKDIWPIHIYKKVSSNFKKIKFRSYLLVFHSAWYYLPYKLLQALNHPIYV